MGYNVTSGIGLPYPDGTEDLDIPGDIGLLAEAVDTAVLQQIADNVVQSAELFLTPTPPTPNVEVVNSKMNIYMTPPDLSSKLDAAGGTVTGDLVITGALTFTPITGSVTVPTPTASGHAATKAYVDGRLPVGLMAPFVGTAAQVPAGWYLCDGSVIPVNASTVALRAMVGANTPDMRSKLPMGSTGESGAYIRGSLYGAASKTLTEANLPSHTHTINSGNATHSHTITVATGGGARTPTGTVPATDTNHTHSGGTGTMNSNWSHAHGGWTGTDGAHAHNNYGSNYLSNMDEAGSGRMTLAKADPSDTGLIGGGYSEHAHSVGIGATDINHTHNFETGWKNHNAAHTHGFTGYSMDINHAHTASSDSQNGAHTHTAVATGSGTAFDIIPPVMAVLYIIYGGA